MSSNGKRDFHEDYISPRTDPLHTTSVEFDYDAIDKALGTASSEQDSITDGYQAIAALVRKMFLFGTDVDLTKKNAQVLIGRRFIALAWVLDPGLFDGTPSASRLADILKITRKADLWTLTGEAARHFGITNRAQDHAWNRAAGSPSSPHRQQRALYGKQVAKGSPEAPQTQPDAKPAPLNCSKESFSKPAPRGGSKADPTASVQYQKLTVP